MHLFVRSTLFSTVDNDVFLRFVQFDLVQLNVTVVLLKLSRELLPDEHGQVLRGADEILRAEIVHVEIEMLVINEIEHMRGDQRFHVGDVHDHACRWIDMADDGHFEHVVVPVPVGIVAFAEYVVVLLIGENMGMESMARGECFTTGQVNFRAQRHRCWVYPI